MGLSAYHKKRLFTRTPEPKGSVRKKSGPLTFVIQKHAASQLHYDFRLEMDGVLKSWAVPKGPSLNPEDKHLSMMVEDHPMEYENFEGIIPRGNYGAGTVMVWDRGVYTPYGAKDRRESEKVLAEQLEKGHLTFVMLGEKVKGEFALVRATRVSENAWLLIKKGDEYASTKDVLREDKSVLTGRNMVEIAKQAEKKKEIWFSKPKNLDLDDAPKSEMPHMVKPMLAETVDDPFDREDWLFELKLDGYRAVAEIGSPSSLRGVERRSNPTNKHDEIAALPLVARNDERVKLYSRNHQPYNERFAPVAESLAKFPGSAVLDGEVVVVDSDGKPNFGWLQEYPKEKKGELRYYVFDILYFDGHNLEKLPLTRRKEMLKQLLPPVPHIFFSDHIETRGIDFFKQAVKLHLEGIMAKKVQSSYRPNTRSSDWLKIKTQKTQTAVIAGFTAPNGGRKHFGALVLGLYKRGKLEYIGHTGGGFNDQDLESIFNRLKPLKQEECSFKIKPKTNAPVTWVKPILSCEVAFSNWTKDKIMRHPIFIGLVDSSKNVIPASPSVIPAKAGIQSKNSVILNEVKDHKDSSSTPQNDKRGGKTPRKFSPDSPSNDIELEVGKQKLSLSNLSKVFWSTEGYTKGDLIEYYTKISPILLPHLIDRPESLLRFPDGIHGESFFQKNASNLTAAWVKKKLITKGEEKVNYILCQDVATLIYLINLGCIDLNPWNSRVNHLGNPDYLIIDLDPEDISFENVVKVALEFRKLFEKLEIPSFPKTSGARGMHIYIPMGAKYTYEQTRRFAELLCYQVLSEIPEVTSMRRSPRERQGKVYLDYLQNARGQTLASVYSIRPKPGAPVSTPLEWSEVTSKLHPSQFTMKNIFKRIDKHGDLFKGVLGNGIDLKNVLKKFEEEEV